MSPSHSTGGKESGTARVLGSGTSGLLQCSSPARLQWRLTRLWLILGIAELLLFHPVDTVAKRLMSNKTKVGIPF